MMSEYFLISNSDGETTVKPLTRTQLLKALDEKHYGDVEFMETIEDGNTNYWNDKVLIIKGEIVTPEPERVVQTYNVA